MALELFKDWEYHLISVLHHARTRNAPTLGRYILEHNDHTNLIPSAKEPKTIYAFKRAMQYLFLIRPPHELYKLNASNLLMTWTVLCFSICVSVLYFRVMCADKRHQATRHSVRRFLCKSRHAKTRAAGLSASLKETRKMEGKYFSFLVQLIYSCIKSRTKHSKKCCSLHRKCVFPNRKGILLEYGRHEREPVKRARRRNTEDAIKWISFRILIVMIYEKTNGKAPDALLAPREKHP